jgi:hypothetical protein
VLAVAELLVELLVVELLVLVLLLVTAGAAALVVLVGLVELAEGLA